MRDDGQLYLDRRGAVVKDTPANSGDTGLIPGSRKSRGGGNGNPFLYSCLENPMDRGDWQATVHGVAESDMTEATYLTHMHEDAQSAL